MGRETFFAESVTLIRTLAVPIFSIIQHIFAMRRLLFCSCREENLREGHRQSLHWTSLLKATNRKTIQVTKLVKLKSYVHKVSNNQRTCLCVIKKRFSLLRFENLAKTT